MRNSKNIRTREAGTPCPKCFNTGTEVVPGKGARSCQHSKKQKRTAVTAVVVDLKAHRDEQVTKNLDGETRQQRIDHILSNWSPAGYRSFNALLQRALTGPLFTPERARALLPTILEVVDEMEASELEELEWEFFNGPINVDPLTQKSA
jgi:hypothetical protein